MSARALELLALPDDEPGLLLDIGCGSGLSGDVLTDAGHQWIGIDVSSAMLSKNPPRYSFFFNFVHMKFEIACCRPLNVF